MTSEQLIQYYYKSAVKGISEKMLVSDNDDWYNYVMGLSIKEKFTYIIIIMNEEVFNGGFDQYFTNTYGRFAFETVPALLEIGSPKRASIVKRALEMVNHLADPPEVFRRKLVTQELPELFKTNELIEKLSPLDDEYCEMDDEDIVEVLGDFLKR